MIEEIKHIIQVYETQGYDSAKKEFIDLQKSFDSLTNKQTAQIRLLMAKLCIAENKLDEINNLFTTGLKTQEKEEYEQLKEKQRLLEIELAEEKRKKNRLEGKFIKEDFICCDGFKILKNHVTWDEFEYFIHKNNTYHSLNNPQSKANHNISLEDALNYCKLLSTKINQEVRLPTKDEIVKFKKDLQFDKNPSIYEWCIDQPGTRPSWRTVINKNMKTHTAKQYGTFYENGASALKMFFRFVIIG